MSGIGFKPRSGADSVFSVSSAGLRYLVEASSDLSDWSDQSDVTAVLTAGQPYTHTDSANLSTTQRRFLRIRVSLFP